MYNQIMTQQSIIISKPNLTPAEIALSRRYLSKFRLFSGQEWRQLRQLNNKLAHCKVVFKNKHYTFRQFYRTFINGSYAYPFLKALPQLTNIAKEGVKLQAIYARKIVGWLRSNGVQRGQIPNAEYLIIYCVSQWGAFARGYIFEAAILRDLQDSGVFIIPHDPFVERYSAYDFKIQNQGYGDIKTSLYFLDDFTTSTPKADFYVTRLYNQSKQQPLRVVFLDEWSWSRLQTTGTMSEKAVEVRSIAQISQVIVLPPKIVQIRVRHLLWFVIEYEKWKDLLRQIQKERNDE